MSTNTRGQGFGLASGGSKEKSYEKSERLLALLQSKLGSHFESAEISLGDVVLRLPRQSAHDVFRLLRVDADFAFDMCVSVTAVDWLDAAPERFEVVYHFLSLKYLYRLRAKVWVPEQEAVVQSVVDIWPGVHFMEREVWDMFGVRFQGHPDLRRVLMYEEFQGHPLRKDYPVQAKQPRVALRAPEPTNTARNLQRPVLVQIQKHAHKNIQEQV